MLAICLLLWTLTVNGGDTTNPLTSGLEESISRGVERNEAVFVAQTDMKQDGDHTMGRYARGIRERTQPNDYGSSRETMARSQGLSGSWPYECEESPQVKCNPFQKYRTMDGRCNNLKNPSWGQTHSCRDRLLPADYADGRWELRVSRKSGKPLPNPRILSLEFNRFGPKADKDLSHMLMEFGRILAEDLTSPIPNFPPFNCCNSDVIDERCNPIPLPLNDPFYSKHHMTCHNLIRRRTCQFCTKGPAQFSNEATTFIDGSFIYGSNETEAKSLRGENGLLGTQNHPTSGELPLPKDDPEADGCSLPEQNLICFKSGRNIINLPNDMSVFTVFLRQHNKLARGLKGMNPKWNSDRIYNEARGILSAQLQMIAYKEYLPIILGRKTVMSASLLPLESGRTIYEPHTNPTILMEFGAAAFRFGHPQVQSFFSEYPRKGKIRGRYLKDMYSIPFVLFHGELEPLITGMLFDPSLKISTYYVPDIMNYLFKERNESTGQDLKLRDIARGREFGIRPYIDYVRLCGGPKIKNFEDLDQMMPKYMRQKFQTLYESVEDVDFVLAGLAEYPYAGGLVGQTFNCIVSKQFYHLKFGDRFYFEHGKQTVSFTDGQLKELRKSTFAKIICEVININEIQRDVMHLPSKENPIVDCNEIPDMDLTEWKDY